MRDDESSLNAELGLDDDGPDGDGIDGDPGTPCEHEPAVGYAVGFAVREDVDGIDSACSMTATVEERDVDAADVDAVGCDVADCPGYHERVADRLRRSAARHSGNPTGDVGREDD